MEPTVIPAVSVAMIRGDQVLLVRRGRPPSDGLYAFPGGRVESGESLQDAARRELLEETGLEAAELSPLTEVDLPSDHGGPGTVFRLTVFRADYFRGEPVAGDDAAEARWFGWAEIDALPMAAAMADTLRRLKARTSQ